MEPIMSQTKYDALLAAGYTETSRRPMSQMSSKGHYVVLERPTGVASAVARAALCVIATPFAVVGTILTCCQVSETYEPCIDHLFFPPCAGGCYVENGYLKDKAATQRCISDDFKALGYDDGYSDANLADYTSKHMTEAYTAPPTRHKFLTLVGDSSNFEYIIIIPNGDSSRAKLLNIGSESGKRLTTADFIDMGRGYCREYREGRMGTVRAFTERTPIAQHVGTTTYGARVEVTTYENRRKYRELPEGE